MVKSSNILIIAQKLKLATCNCLTSLKSIIAKSMRITLQPKAFVDKDKCTTGNDMFNVWITNKLNLNP